MSTIRGEARALEQSRMAEKAGKRAISSCRLALKVCRRERRGMTDPEAQLPRARRSAGQTSHKAHRGGSMQRTVAVLMLAETQA